MKRDFLSSLTLASLLSVFISCSLDFYGNPRLKVTFEELRQEYELNQESFVKKYSKHKLVTLDDDGFCFKKNYLEPFKCLNLKIDSVYFEE